jgi:hypothetical protein
MSNTAIAVSAPPEGAPTKHPAQAVVMTPEPHATIREADSQEQPPTSRQPYVPDLERTRAILRGEIDPRQDAPAAAAARGRQAGANGHDDNAEDLTPFFDEDGNFLDEEPQALEAAAQGNVSAGMAGTEPAAEEAGAEASSEDADHDRDQTSAGEDSKTLSPEAVAAEEKPGPRKRISITRNRLGDRDFAAVQLADREQISIPEAYRRLYGEESLAAPAEARREEETPTGAPAAQPPSPARIQGEIEHLLAQRQEASKSLDLDRANTLNDRINDLRDLQRDAQQAVARAQEEHAQSYRDAVTAAANQALDLYPGAGEEGSSLFEAIDAARLERLRTDPHFFRSTHWPTALAVEVAGALGIAPSVRQAATAGQAADPGPATAGPVPRPSAAASSPAPRKAARPAPPAPAPGNASAAAGSSHPEAVLRGELQAAKTTNDPEQVRAVFRKIDAHHARVGSRRAAGSDPNLPGILST